MSAFVGFDRKIKRAWLDACADQVAMGRDASHLRLFLHEMLRTEQPAETARGKTVTVLMRIWATVPEAQLPLRQHAVDLLKDIPAQDRIWLHWGMCTLAYPLFRDTAAAIGRFVKLQGELALAQLHRRLINAWGERSTVRRALQRIVRSMVEWQTLADAKAPGHFHAVAKLMTNSTPLQLWFLRAAHVAARAELLESEQLLTLPSSFPFKLTIGKADLRHSEDFVMERQGFDLDMVAVAHNGRSKQEQKQEQEQDQMILLSGR